MTPTISADDLLAGIAREVSQRPSPASPPGASHEPVFAVEKSRIRTHGVTLALGITLGVAVLSGYGMPGVAVTIGILITTLAVIHR